MTYTYRIDSETALFETKLDMDQPITVLFQRENIVLQADPDGHAVFCRTDGRELLNAKADGKTSRFHQIRCLVKKDAIVVNFPIIYEFHYTQDSCLHPNPSSEWLVSNH